ncbi:hypothetical protein [Nitrospirillum sp. BR 11828]|uniref:hypothetical protein n=1 Tax=Nitrospirillum sp. BR 11828 TaxID=3104325 RepID=UPI002ACA653D|nr:hypothetical protein [Nitrospirillum sp. BR 11828]MDZ5646989.1 hypothetical protein [Nitrospirillum sp. BR 11828]
MIVAEGGSAAAGGTGAAADKKTRDKKAEDQKTDSEFAALLQGGKDDPKATLAEITTGGVPGYWAWRLKELKAEIASRVMGQMGVTHQGLAAMSEDDRAEVERLIMREVARVVREMTTGQTRKGPGLEDLPAGDGAMPGDAVPQAASDAGTNAPARAASRGLDETTLSGMLSQQEIAGG